MTKTYKINIANKPINVTGDIELTKDQAKEIATQYFAEVGAICVTDPTPTRKRKYFVPKDGGVYYYINNQNEIEFKNNIRGNAYFNGDIKSGNCFATEQDAQDELNRRQALVRIWNNYDDKYSWDIDWEDRTQQKHYITYAYDLEEFVGQTASHCFQSSTELPYFKSAEDRNQFVEANLSDLLIIFNIKK